VRGAEIRRIPQRNTPMIVRPSHLLVAGGVTVLAGIAVMALATLPSPWADLRPATCMPADCFCEEIRDSLVRQPVNTMSGLLFLPVGILILLTGRRGPRAAAGGENLLRTRRVYSRIFGGATILVGLGTALYHASLTFVGQTMDLLGMYLLVTFFLVYNLSRLSPLPQRTVLALYVLGNAALLVLLLTVPELRRHAFAALVVTVLASEIVIRRRRRVRMRTRYLLGAVLVLAAGFLVWVMDLAGVACDPEGWLQGHAVWHLAGAGATWLVFLFYRSETTSPRADG
jgi:hypothetical protein